MGHNSDLGSSSSGMSGLDGLLPLFSHSHLVNPRNKHFPTCAPNLDSASSTLMVCLNPERSRVGPDTFQTLLLVLSHPTISESNKDKDKTNEEYDNEIVLSESGFKVDTWPNWVMENHMDMIWHVYDIPADITIRLCRPGGPLASFFHCGLHLPLSLERHTRLLSYGVAPVQIAINGWGVIMGLFVLWKQIIFPYHPARTSSCLSHQASREELAQLVLQDLLQRQKDYHWSFFLHQGLEANLLLGGRQ